METSVYNESECKKYYQEHDIKLSEISMSVRAYNGLLFSGFKNLSEIIDLEIYDLLKLNNLGYKSAKEVVTLCNYYIQKYKRLQGENEVEKKYNEDKVDVNIDRKEIKDCKISDLNLSYRTINQLLNQGYVMLSEIINFPYLKFLMIDKMGAKSAKEIFVFCSTHKIYQLNKNDEFNEVKEKICSLLKSIGFSGYALTQIQYRLQKESNLKTIKKAIGLLINEKKIEYVDYKCYYIYPSFFDFIKNISIKQEKIIKQRLSGKTFDEIGQDFGITRERVRQIVLKGVQEAKKELKIKLGVDTFNEDYYLYLFENYDTTKEFYDFINEDKNLYNYLKMVGSANGTKSLIEVFEDENIPEPLKIRINMYIDRNKIFLNGDKVLNKRSSVEDYIVQNYCLEDTTFNEFVEIYNDCLKKNHIKDNDLYLTDDVVKTRINKLDDSRRLLWKFGKTFRYYDIESRDYTELLDELNLNFYNNIVLSTYKFYEKFPNLMKKYDIRDHYELHNLLKKIINTDEYPNMKFTKMPMIKFGEFNYKQALIDIINSSDRLTPKKLAEIVHQEYGYEMNYILANLNVISDLLYGGYYSVEQKLMSSEKLEKLKNVLVDDFYYIDEIKKIYRDLDKSNDDEEINSSNLKKIGFRVFSTYAIQNYSSAYQFFRSELLKDDLFDLTKYRTKYTYVMMFSEVLNELKRNYDLFEYKENKMISIKRLATMEITKDSIKEFCDQVVDKVEVGEFFTIKYLKDNGFEFELDELGFDDYFYDNIIANDPRFKFTKIQGHYVLCKTENDILASDFLMNILEENDKLEEDELIAILETYGIVDIDPTKLRVMNNGTTIFYSPLMQKYYKNREVYYEEIN